MKLTIVGGGGFRVPLVYGALLAKRETLPFDEVVLHDLDAGRMERMAGVLRGLAEERGATLPFRATTDLDDAVEGADFVFSAIRVGRLEGRVVDESVPLSLGVLGQETTGPGGICFALRTIPEMVRLAETIAERAPARLADQLHQPGRHGHRGAPAGARRPRGRHLRLADAASAGASRARSGASPARCGSTTSASTTSAGCRRRTTPTATACRSCSPTTRRSPASRRAACSAATGCGRSG